MKTTYILLLALIGTFINSAAQDRIVNGIVTAFDNIPLYGVSIKSGNTKKVTATDSTGRFSISCAAGDKIIITADGFYRQKITLGAGTKFAAVNLKMKPGEKNREYAIGYGKVSESNKLYAGSNLTDKDADFASYSNVYDLIHARFPGVQVKNGEIIIRGTQSFTGSNSALIILNNMPVDNTVLSGIRPKEIKSIDIMRDGGAAVYGSRGANGVVIIETK
jgi:TonB-dependent SusC/RagA subfamily outer membrane receptor